ncbi:MAG: hypothetical protein F4X93_01100 [Proteobacteria bacterium]|nr:hypothetical protein [Pseudomonadota bacterium]
MIAPPFEAFQTGCLLADAKDVQLDTKQLPEIEGKCIPWHFLFCRSMFVRYRPQYIPLSRAEFEMSAWMFVEIARGMEDEGQISERDNVGWNAPTIDDLNQNTQGNFDKEGVHPTTREELMMVMSDKHEGSSNVEFDRAWFLSQGIHRLLAIDVRNERGFGVQEEPDNQKA